MKRLALALGITAFGPIQQPAHRTDSLWCFESITTFSTASLRGSRPTQRCIGLSSDRSAEQG
jgi:hypothetical protein